MAGLNFDTYSSFVLYVKKQKNLTKEEALVLLKEYHNNPTEEVMNQLMDGHLPIVLSIVSKYKDNTTADPMDLILSGLNGLFHAIVNFDFQMNTLFSTFAYSEIERAVRDFIRKLSHPVKIPERIVRKYIEIMKTRKMLADKFKRQPTNKEVMDELDFEISEYEMQNIIESCQAPLSLDRLVDAENDENLTFKDMLVSEDDPVKKVEADIEEEVLKEALDSLPSKYREIILERYRPTENGKPVPFDQLPNKDHDSISQMRYMEDWSFDKISEYYERKLNRKL